MKQNSWVLRRLYFWCQRINTFNHSTTSIFECVKTDLHPNQLYHNLQTGYRLILVRFQADSFNTRSVDLTRCNCSTLAVSHLLSLERLSSEVNAVNLTQQALFNSLHRSDSQHECLMLQHTVHVQTCQSNAHTQCTRSDLSIKHTHSVHVQICQSNTHTVYTFRSVNQTHLTRLSCWNQSSSVQFNVTVSMSDWLTAFRQWHWTAKTFNSFHIITFSTIHSHYRIHALSTLYHSNVHRATRSGLRYLWYATISGPASWNSLPAELRTISDTSVF